MEQNDTLLTKWLDDELSAEELVEFQKTNEYQSYQKIKDHMVYFKEPDFDEERNYDNLSEKIKHKQPPKLKSNFPSYLKIAAAVTLLFGLFGLYSIFNTSNTTINTIAGEKTSVTLPDESVVQLNALSNLSFNTKKWKKNRVVLLNGEAFFKVTKGATFDVKTNDGIVSVLGTQFNVKQRKDYFEVSCFEGLVSVTYKEKIKKLTAGKTFKVINNQIIEENLTTTNIPDWMNNESSFKSTPLHIIINELKLQYSIDINVSNVNKNTLFSGSFTHNNLNLALKSICIPLNLDYKINDNKVSITINDR